MPERRDEMSVSVPILITPLSSAMFCSNGKGSSKGASVLHSVYLSELAVQTLQNWRAQFPDALPDDAVFPREAYGLKGKKSTFGGTVEVYKVFPDQPIGSWKTAWGSAKRVAGVECRWHDLRHSAASRLAAGGATDQTLQALLGWMSPKMIERYSHVRNEAKRKAVRVFDNPQDRESPPINHHNEKGPKDERVVTN
jgi:integrase